MVRALAVLGVLILGDVMMVALVAFRSTDDPRFSGAAAEMEAVARTLKDGERLGPRTVGGLAFEEVRRERGVVVFQEGENLASPYGYAWSPQGDPARRLEDAAWSQDHVDHSFEHLRDGFSSWQARR
ncbi:hypothetical protein [Nonomuraea endophytica]|uniref:Uncharacterized protein n=1 Tax=Nonomuraea endophytica TaxID=714136 RepID=A0A7W8A3V3_9ACTN|nr:hypothetical protein [Nonomuraea endophytica]MBB5079048.1 hypothetical protein [Nonomuraea endophytica]